MKGKIFSWRNFHKWVGVIIALFLIVFCVSGIILNHRAVFRHCDVPRCILPSDYSVKNYNNGVVKGTIALEDGRIVAFGNGVWLPTISGRTTRRLFGDIVWSYRNRLFGRFRCEDISWQRTRF